jgi:hydroxymethylglutaryl-CoA reductase (NADPH)
MHCKGKGKVQRFAKLIAGFALSLELSTHAAIASGQFARAHQKLGRNKPVKWLLASELTEPFFKEHLVNLPAAISGLSPAQAEKLDNGILTDLAAKASKKLIGFVPVDLNLANGQLLRILLKSKALGAEVVDGLHFMASNLNSELADTLLSHKELLEYGKTHLLEIEIYRALNEMDYPFMPQYYGDKIEPEREIYLFFIERLAPQEMTLFNVENSPELWSTSQIISVIKAIHEVHRHFANKINQGAIPSISEFNLAYAEKLYHHFIAINRLDYNHLELDSYFDYLSLTLVEWQENGLMPIARKTLIHNDFNPRNVAIRKDGRPCIYDWELAILNIPQRDIFEFLAFSLPFDFLPSQLEDLLKQHWPLVQELNVDYSWQDYRHDFKLAGDEFLISRVCFYLAGSTLVNYPFIERVFKVSFKMLATIKTF